MIAVVIRVVIGVGSDSAVPRRGMARCRREQIRIELNDGIEIDLLAFAFVLLLPFDGDALRLEIDLSDDCLMNATVRALNVDSLTRVQTRE